jgi:hypothetical protein
MTDWDWKIQSYKDKEMKRLCLETVHVGEASRDFELAAIKVCNRYARVTNLHTNESYTVSPC